MLTFLHIVHTLHTLAYKHRIALEDYDEYIRKQLKCSHESINKQLTVDTVIY